MGNKNSAPNYDKFSGKYITNKELFVQYNDNRNYYLTYRKYESYSSEKLPNHSLPYILPINSKIIIDHIETINKELVIYGNIATNIESFTTEINMWPINYYSKLVNITCLFRIINDKSITVIGK